jgi:hypothetical protein
MKRIHDRRLAALITTLVLGCSALAGSTAAHSPDPVLAGGSFAQNQALKFSWRSGAVPVAAIQTAIKAAAADVTATRGSRAATFTYAASGGNPIGYGLGATCGVNGIACFTRTAPTSFTMWLREQGHVFDWGTMKWCQAYAVPPGGCYDAETIALDEFGHVEGLDHHLNYADGSDYLDAVVQTFSHAKPQVGWNMHAFGVCDVATLQHVYDMLTWSAKYSSCGQLSTTLTVAAPASVVYGGGATLVATLKVTDATAYGRLGGNPLSGRVVTLQTRAPGATTWLSAGTMTAGSTSGTYVKSVTLTADIQARAVFKAPTDEGLGGSTSSVATIDVGACKVAPCPMSAPAGSQ